MAWAGGDFDLGQRATLVALAAFSAVWVTALGAAVGSFLNVVVYRLPQRMSLVRPKSHCPKCATPILARDNLPVIGWLRLRGRCRACGTPISARYPLVEAATAFLFLGLAHFELFSGGANLPGGPAMPTGLAAVLWHLQPEAIGVYLYHITLLATLLCLTLIAWDGFRPPRVLIAVASTVGLFVPVFLSVARPVKSGLPMSIGPRWQLQSELVSITVVPAELLEGGLGLAVGLAVGALLAGAVPRGQYRIADRSGVIAAGGLAGVFLGWQAVIACGLAAAVLAIGNAIASWAVRRTLPVTGIFAATVLVHLLWWRSLSAWALWPGARGWNIVRRIGWPDVAFDVSSLAAAAAATGLAATLAGLIAARRNTPTAANAFASPAPSGSNAASDAN
ncbi:MAG: prepilin peptidase [Planctomycetaceae bacterium]|nr:prepilin peptidase [Planctomycetaceae bacterium]